MSAVDATRAGEVTVSITGTASPATTLLPSSHTAFETAVAASKRGLVREGVTYPCW